MKKTMTITRVAERTLSEFGDYRDEVVSFNLFVMLNSPHFHWLELRTTGEVTRIEAIRENPDPDKNHQWERPQSFRVLHTKGEQESLQKIPRGEKGTGLFSLQIHGIPIQELDFYAILKHRSFVLLAFCVGRLTNTIAPKKKEER